MNMDSIGTQEQDTSDHWIDVPVEQTLTELSEDMDNPSPNPDAHTSTTVGSLGKTNKGMSVFRLPKEITISAVDVSDDDDNDNDEFGAVTNRRKNGRIGRPITSPRTLARNFPSNDLIREKLSTEECFLRPRVGGGHSDVWTIFEEIAYSDTQEFTGIVRCRNCSFMTRYHGQITGTSHMRRHRCFMEAYPEVARLRSLNKLKIQNKAPVARASTSASTALTANRRGRKRKMTHEIEVEIPAETYENFTKMSDAETNEFINYYTCKKCKILIRADATLMTNHTCRLIDIKSPAIAGDSLLFRGKPKNRMTPIWENFQEVIDPTSEQILGYVRCKLCHVILRISDPKTMQKTLRSHVCPAISRSNGGDNQMEVNKVVPKAVIGKNSVTVKADYREKVIQFCYSELVSLESVTSDSFKVLAQSLMALGAVVGRSNVALPEIRHLYHQLHGKYVQLKERIKEELTSALNRNIGGALVCDSQDDLCVLSVYYINHNWQLIETVLSATTQGSDINSFISSTLDDYGLNEEEKLSKFTFVSRGGLFDGVSICLTSMAHLIDGVIENAVFGDDSYTEVVDNCRIICNELQLDAESYRIEWINKYEVMRHVIENQHKFELKNSSLDLELVKFIVDFLSPFKAASIELRQCNKHPTMNHVLLWYYKLMKALAVFESDDSLATSLKTTIKSGLEQNFQLQPLHKIAAFLWPNFRFLKMLSNDEREQIHKEVRSLIESRIVADDETIAKKNRSDFTEWEDMAVPDLDEVNKYISVQLTTCNEKNILIWWKEHAYEFPKLARLAKWILSIPASVTSIERYKIASSHDVSEELLFLHCNL